MSAIAIFKPLLTPIPTDPIGLNVVKKIISTAVDEVDKAGGAKLLFKKMDLPFAPLSEMKQLEVDHFINSTIKDEKVRDFLTSEPVKTFAKCATECAVYAGEKMVEDYMMRRTSGDDPQQAFKGTVKLAKTNCNNVLMGVPPIEMKPAMYAITDEEYKQLMLTQFGCYIE